MKFAGGLMVFLGIGSLILKYMGTELMMLSWIDDWGPTVAQAIRIGLIVVGAALWLVASKRETSG
jgi:hypothetical protein